MTVRTSSLRALPLRAARLVIGRGTFPQRQWRLKLAYALSGGDYGSSRIGWREKAALARRGFLPLAHAMYDFAAHDHDSYLSDYEREQTMTINGTAARLLDDKALLTFMLAGLDVPVPAIHAIIGRGELRWLDPSAGPIDERSLRDRLDGGPIVVKPVMGGGGHGFHLIASAGGSLLLDGEPVDWPALERFLRGLDYGMLTDFVRQAGYSAEVYAYATNTIRILTVLRRGAADPVTAIAVHRFGTARSRPVDNWSKGGLSARIDLETGVLGPAMARPDGGEAVWHDRHPETGSPIAGATVPRWREIRRTVWLAAKGLSFVPYIGWDVVPTDTGCSVIEGNKFTSVGLLQIHGPLLEDPEIRAFYEEHGALRRQRPRASR